MSSSHVTILEIQMHCIHKLHVTLCTHCIHINTSWQRFFKPYRLFSDTKYSVYEKFTLQIELPPSHRKPVSCCFRYSSMGTVPDYPICASRNFIQLGLVISQPFFFSKENWPILCNLSFNNSSRSIQTTIMFVSLIASFFECMA